MLHLLYFVWGEDSADVTADFQKGGGFHGLLGRVNGTMVTTRLPSRAQHAGSLVRSRPEGS